MYTQIESETLKCSACGEHRARSEFTKGRTKCRPCAAAYQRSYRAKNPVRVKEWTRSSYRTHREAEIAGSRAYEAKRRAADPVGFLVARCKVQARRRGIEFNITYADIMIPDLCPIFGVLLDPIGAGTDNVPSIDRLDSTKGYIPGNVWVISSRANRLKNDGTAQEHETIAAAIRSEEAKRSA